jgi:hypothetical protein
MGNFSFAISKRNNLHIVLVTGLEPSTSIIYQWLYDRLLDLGRFFGFLIFYAVCRTPWTGDQPVARQLPAHWTAQAQNKRTQTPMPQAGFEPTIPVLERAKTVHALDGAATVIGRPSIICGIYIQYINKI